MQRLEFAADVTREDFEAFLEGIVSRLALPMLDGTQVRSIGVRSSGAIRFGALGIRGESRLASCVPQVALPATRRTYELTDEVATIEWMHEQVSERAQLPLLEAESVVRSLAVAMHGDQEMLLPLLSLREFDEYTTTHSLNVSVLTMALAEAMGMGARDVRAFGVAGLLHDLGKTRIPLEVLNKPGKLTDEEWVAVRRHPQLSEAILSPVPALADVARLAVEHHERVDGSGYPYGLVAHQLDVPSRVLQVADVAEALSARRPYRGAMDDDAVLRVMGRDAGSKLDAAAFGALEAWLPRAGARTLVDAA